MSSDFSQSGQIVYLGQRAAPAGFTPRDNLEIERWAEHGRRTTICHGDHGPYAMLYEGAKPWASWGVMRQGANVTVWDCVTFADIGCFSSMHAALAAIPSDLMGAFVPLANVIAFTPVVRNTWVTP